MGICRPRAVVLLCCRKDFTNYLPKLQSSTPAFLQSGSVGKVGVVGIGGGGLKKKNAGGRESKGKEGEGKGAQGMHFKVSPAIGWGGAGPNVKS